MKTSSSLYCALLALIATSSVSCMIFKRIIATKNTPLARTCHTQQSATIPMSQLYSLHKRIILKEQEYDSLYWENSDLRNALRERNQEIERLTSVIKKLQKNEQ